MIDLDHFKRINDENGHAAGDAALKQAVAACSAQLRSVDVHGRLGGEEFGILLPECDLDCATACAERIRVAVAASSTSRSSGTITVTASLGVSDVRRAGYDLKSLMQQADEALYRAKDAGRNRVAA